ncbi:MAG: phnA protein [Marinobacterium sp.]|nr:phnA protein [Marinobacterium sp.]
MSAKQKTRIRTTGLAIFGKELIRRCGSHCELCKAQGVKLVVHEVPPSPGTPDPEHCIMVCEDCQRQLLSPKRIEASHWRCLAASMWSDIPAVKVTSLLMLQQLEETEPWAAELLEQAWLAPEEARWLSDAGHL